VDDSFTSSCTKLNDMCMAFSILGLLTGWDEWVKRKSRFIDSPADGMITSESAR